MSWHYLFETATGRLLSEADGGFPQNIPSPLPRGVSALVRESRAVGDEMWDEATRDFVARTPKVLVDRLDDFNADPDGSVVRDRLNPANQGRLDNALIRLLGDERFRNPDTDTPTPKGKP